MEKEYKMSQARKDELEQELNYLKTTRVRRGGGADQDRPRLRRPQRKQRV